MRCEDYQASLADLLGGDIEPARRTALDAHAAGCDACRALTADLRRISQAAAALDRHAPPRDGWTRLARRLEAEPGFGATAGRRPLAFGRGYRLPPWTWTAVAATLIAAVTVTLVVFKRSLDERARTTITASNPARNDLVESIESELQLAAGHYEKAIAALEQVANQGDSPLDPEVMATVRQNLAVIDRAIDESRSALRTQPESQLAQQSLFDAFRRKVSLLQDTIALMNEMRKGNQAGAARIAEGPNKS